MSDVPFRFQFDLDDENGDDGRREVLANSTSNAAVPSEDKQPKFYRKPFQLLPDLKVLLEERCQQALEFEQFTIGPLPTTNDTNEQTTRPLRRVHQSSIDRSHRQYSSDTINSHTDLIPGVYEGGLKVWECSVDLCRYLADVHWNDEFVPSPLPVNSSSELTVLELGCGHGLPGCVLLRQAIEERRNLHVFFTDYNDYVLRDVTLSNIVLNTTAATQSGPSIHEILQRVSMGAGDWMSLSEQLISGELKVRHGSRFNVVLAAETTYTVEAAKATAALMARHLKPEIGVGLVAAKRYYFGVGGGTDAFSSAAAELERNQWEGDFRMTVKVMCLEHSRLALYTVGQGTLKYMLHSYLMMVFPVLARIATRHTS